MEKINKVPTSLMIAFSTVFAFVFFAILMTSVFNTDNTLSALSAVKVLFLFIVNTALIIVLGIWLKKHSTVFERRFKMILSALAVCR